MKHEPNELPEGVTCHGDSIEGRHIHTRDVKKPVLIDTDDLSPEATAEVTEHAQLTGLKPDGELLHELSDRIDVLLTRQHLLIGDIMNSDRNDKLTEIDGELRELIPRHIYLLACIGIARATDKKEETT